jgi:hypothetical protein
MSPFENLSKLIPKTGKMTIATKRPPRDSLTTQWPPNAAANATRQISIWSPYVPYTQSISFSHLCSQRSHASVNSRYVERLRLLLASWIFTIRHFR